MRAAQKEREMDGRVLAERLLAYARAHLHLEEEDAAYARNALLTFLRLPAPARRRREPFPIRPTRSRKNSPPMRSKTDCARRGRGAFWTDMLGALTPLPSVINREFFRRKEERGTQAACDYLYDLSVKNGYVRASAIARNLKWEYDDGKCGLEITVNLSKPEKSNKDIAKLLTRPAGREVPRLRALPRKRGVRGHGDAPAAAQPAHGETHPRRRALVFAVFAVRLLRRTLHRHKRAARSHARRRHHAAKTAGFRGRAANYFIGSNASLPVVGGSILNHEHFQGGRHLMPMHRAKLRTEYAGADFPSLRIGVLDWYNSAVQCEGEDAAQVAAFAGKVIEGWRGFDCPSCDILSHTGGTPHNTCSLSCRREGKKYIFTVILRNNRADGATPTAFSTCTPNT